MAAHWVSQSACYAACLRSTAPLCKHHGGSANAIKSSKQSRLLVTDDDALDAAAAACGPAAAVQPQVEGPPPLMMARQAARGLDPAQEEQHDRLHSGELTSTSVGIFELIDKSVRDVLHHKQAPV